jgi:hypothetical protein
MERWGIVRRFSWPAEINSLFDKMWEAERPYLEYFD